MRLNFWKQGMQPSRFYYYFLFRATIAVTVFGSFVGFVWLDGLSSFECVLGENRGLIGGTKRSLNSTEHEYFALPKSKNSPSDTNWSAVYDGSVYCSYSSSCQASADTHVMFVILSAPHNFLRREAVRETWASEMRKGKKFCDSKSNLPSVDYRFFVGYPENRETFDQMLAESAKYGDLVITTDVTDRYSSLVKKVIRGFQYFERCLRLQATQLQEHREDAATSDVRHQFDLKAGSMEEKEFDAFASKYLIVKTDDDNFVNVEKILHFAANHRTGSSGSVASIYGYLHVCAKARRDPTDKWFVSVEQYPQKYYPNYVSGALYIATFGAVRLLIDAALHLDASVNVLAWEDVFISGILPQLTSQPVQVKRLPNVNFDRVVSLDPCVFQNYFYNSHYILAADMRLFWKKFSLARFSSSCALFWTYLI